MEIIELIMTWLLRIVPLLWLYWFMYPVSIPSHWKLGALRLCNAFIGVLMLLQRTMMALYHTAAGRIFLRSQAASESFWQTSPLPLVIYLPLLILAVLGLLVSINDMYYALYQKHLINILYRYVHTEQIPKIVLGTLYIIATYMYIKPVVHSLGSL